MDQDDFDNFEFIDYTTSGPWERFIVQIEDCLKQWGLIHNSYGVFNPTLMPTTPTNDVLNLNKELALAIDGDQKDILQHNPNLNTTTTPLTATILNPDISSNNGSSGTSGNSVYQHNAIVTLDRDSYVLSYSYHPAKARMAVGVEQIDLDFLPTKLEGHEHHILHRWTALTHILILAPAPTDTADGDSSSSVIVDLGSAKLLLSSFAIAFQNTGCNIPVFVPTGHPKNKTYTGLSIQPLQLSTQQQHTFGNAIELGLEDTPEDQAIEVRFNTVVVSYPPAQYTNLSGILDLFIERMGIEDEYASHDSFNAGRDGTNDDSNNGYSREVKEQIYVSGLFSYQLENWYDDDWRQWTDASIKNDEDSDNASGDGDGDDDDGDGDGDDDDDNENDELKQLSKDMKRSPLSTVAVSPISKVPVLPLGPIHDPLKTFHLVARFASAPSTVYLDSKNFTDMEASQANIWTLRVQLKREDYGLLSGVLEEAISSWQRDVSNSDVISPNSEITYPTSFMGFLKAVWTELLVEFTNHWEAREMIPLVQVYGENTYTSSRSDYKPNNEGETAIDDKPLEYNGDNDDNAANNRTPTIDLRFNLIHQKLSMINCCIARENAERQQESTTEIDTNILVDDMSSLFSKASSTPVSAKSTPDPVVFELLDTTNEASPEDQESRTNVEEIKDNDQSVLDRQTSPEEDNDTSDISKAEDPLIEGPDALTSEPTRSTVDVPAAIAPTGSLTASQLYENEVKREGVMSAFNDLTLLETGAQLFVPKLQEPGYMTEDMIKQQEDIFEGLGSSSDAAKIRAQMQSAQLIS
ncbi:Rab3 GTPase-activating protein catalytic subunit, partial [Lobosporangium transversale]